VKRSQCAKVEKGDREEARGPGEGEGRVKEGLKKVVVWHIEGEWEQGMAWGRGQGVGVGAGMEGEWGCGGRSGLYLRRFIRRMGYSRGASEGVCPRRISKRNPLHKLSYMQKKRWRV